MCFVIDFYPIYYMLNTLYTPPKEYNIVYITHQLVWFYVCCRILTVNTVSLNLL